MTWISCYNFVFPILMHLLIQTKRHFDFFFLFQILFLATFIYNPVMDVTIDYLTSTEYVKLHTQQFLA